MKLNKKGQALVEFVLVLPILVLILSAAIDIGKIIYTKNNLQNKLDEAIELLQNDESYDNTVASINASSSTPVYLNVVYKEDNYIIVKVSSNINIMTPIMNSILDNPYQVIEKRKVYYNETTE